MLLSNEEGRRLLKGFTLDQSKQLATTDSPKPKAKAKKSPEQKRLERIAEQEYRRLVTKTATAMGLPAPIFEHKFDRTRGWKFDLYFRSGSIRVALEKEGGIYTEGRHTRPTGFIKDMEKYNAAAAQGIHLIRCAPKDIITCGLPDVAKVFRHYQNEP